MVVFAAADGTLRLATTGDDERSVRIWSQRTRTHRWLVLQQRSLLACQGRSWRTAPPMSGIVLMFLPLHSVRRGPVFASDDFRGTHPQSR